LLKFFFFSFRRREYEPHDETITNTLEETHVFSVHGESSTYIGILLQSVVDVVSKSYLLFVREGMGSSVGTTPNLVDLSVLSSGCHLCRVSNEENVWLGVSMEVSRRERERFFFLFLLSSSLLFLAF
jgi:hypothetical protein